MDYSAQVSAYLQVGETILTVAKTNGATLSLAEPSTISAEEWSKATLAIVTDGDADVKEVILVEGLAVGQQKIRYVAEAV